MGLARCRRGADRHYAVAGAGRTAACRSAYARHLRLRRGGLDHRGAGLRRQRRRHRRADGHVSRALAERGQSESAIWDGPGPDHGGERIRQYRTHAGCCRAVPCRGDDDHRSRSAYRLDGAAARRRPHQSHRHGQHHRFDRVGVPGTERDSARRCRNSDHDGRHSRFRRGAKKPLCRNDDDHHRSGGEHLECRHQDRRGAKHDRHRFHPIDPASRRHLAELADRRRAVFHPDVGRALLHHDVHDAAGNQGNAWRQRGCGESTRRARPDDGERKAAARRFPHSVVLLGNGGNPASVRTRRPRRRSPSRCCSCPISA